MIKMVVTDLDGTLLSSKRKVSATDFQTLITLGKEGIIRVIATGRSPYSFSRVIPADFPIDYLVFSSGTGVMEYPSREILITHTIPSVKVFEIATILRQEQVSFKVLAPVPDNQYYHFHESGNSHFDFYRRMELYRGFEQEISFDPPNFGDASQFLIILPDNVKLYESLKSKCHGVKVVRATSPIDQVAIWMEIFHPDVSKAHGVDYLAKRIGILPSEIIGIGNDYNDLDLLAYTGQSYVVESAPEEIKRLYTVVHSNDKNGVTHAVRQAGLLPE